MKKTFDVEGVPPKAGPYSHAVIANGSVYVCGQAPLFLRRMSWQGIPSKNTPSKRWRISRQF